MATRREYSLDRLATLGERLGPVRPLLAGQPICVYATGSYGRLEGWSGSDVDLFFLYDGDDDADRFPWITFTRLAACLVDATEATGFPPFSGDGRCLEVLYVREMERVLGSPDDDSTNAFMARMLLLLESQPVYDAELYASLLERIVGFYYRDFADHAEDFVPGFLVNDILRFWRTLTLNYEHHRRQLQDLAGEELRRKKASSALKNYKLNVSRMATCCGHGAGHAVGLDVAQSGAHHAFGTILKFVVDGDELVEDVNLLGLARHQPERRASPATRSSALPAPVRGNHDPELAVRGEAEVGECDLELSPSRSTRAVNPVRASGPQSTLVTSTGVPTIIACSPRTSASSAPTRKLESCSSSPYASTVNSSMSASSSAAVVMRHAGLRGRGSARAGGLRPAVLREGCARRR